MSKPFWLTSRRQFLVSSLAAGAALTLPQRGPAQEKPPKGEAQEKPPKGDSDQPFKLPELPYPVDALGPLFSKEQMEYHYGKHHAGYFKKLNALVAGKPEGKQSLRELMVSSEEALSNNAAQAWNHTFFWNCLSPKGGGEPKGKLREAIERDFGSISGLQGIFSEAATGLFGSGWVWLATDKKGALHIMALSNAANPVKFEKEPVLTIDVWEHAYYIDYRNERPRYVEAFWTKINWESVAKTYDEIVKPA